jgi:hypothetical protein
MIVFDLECAAQHHIFEAWFGSTADFENQRARQLLACPICGDARIAKAMMAPNISAKGNTSPANQSSTQARISDPVAIAKPVPTAIEAKAMLAALARAQAAMLEKSTWVGRQFAHQARAMDAGEMPHESIYGEVSSVEARELIDDGIGVMPLPLPVTPPKQLN